MTNASHNIDIHFYYGADGKPVAMSYNGSMYAYLYNAQGDVVALFDQAGEVTVRYRYGAWGELLRCWGDEAGTVGFWQPFRYRGYLWDWETGDYYLRSRYYRAEWGRFLNADEHITANLYRYCINNPVLHLDPNGDDEENIFEEETYLLEDEIGMSLLFELVHWPKIAVFFASPGDYRYNPNGYRRISIRKNGKIKPGSIACAHLLFEITGHGSITSKYRFSQAKRLGIRSGALFDRNGQLQVELKEGMEVYKPSYYRDENGNRIRVENGHVGMLIIYDFGDGPEWAVVQSASARITKCKSNWESDPGGGPVITSFRRLDGGCDWVNFTDPRWDK